MSLSDQVQKLKDHWLVIVVILFLFLVLSNNSFIPSNFVNKLGYTESAIGGYARGDIALDSYYPIEEGFAPGVTNRKISRNAHASIDVKRGNFDNSINNLKTKISNYEAIVINENIYATGEGISKTKSANYNLKLREDKYEEFVSGLGDLGEIDSFSENARDITENYLDVQEELNLEMQRLDRYKSLLSQSNSIEEKISLTDRIFDQERSIKYLEESLKNQDIRIEYITLNLNLNEERSNFAGTLFVSLKEIIRAFISSLNSLISIVVYLIPWLILIWIIRIFWKPKSR